MLRLKLLIVSLLIFLFTNAGTTVNIKPAPSWILSTTVDPSRNSNVKNISNGYYLDLLDRQVNIEAQSTYVHIIRHIVNETGVQDASEVSVSFSPQYQQVSFHKVVVIRNGEIINQLNSTAIKTADEESEAPSYLYNGTRRAYIILKNIQKGDQIEYSFSITGFNPVLDGHYSGEYYFYNSTPIVNYSLSLLFAPTRKVNYKLFNGAAAPVKEKSGTLEVYQWKNPDIDNSDNGPDVPSWHTNIPYVTFSDFADWKEVNQWGQHTFKNYSYTLPKKLLQKIAGWKKISGDDKDLFANLALRYVQDQIRYLGLEIGTNTHEPHSPEMVFDQGFGDCKDKALLLVMILRSEKIPAFVALTNTEERENLSLSEPSSMAFDHAIVAIQRGKNFIFIDPTQSLQRGELINNYIPAYSWALVLEPGGENLSSVEPGFIRYTNVVEDLTVSLEDTSFLKVITVYKGGAADDIRNSLASSSMKELNESYLRYYNKLFDGIETDTLISTTDDSLKNEITILESYKIPRIWQKNNEGKLQVSTYAQLLASKLPNPSDHHPKDPVSLDFPYTIEYILRMKMPENWNLSMEETHIKNDSYQFDFTPVGNGSRLVFKYYFKSFRDYIPATDLAQYKEDYKKIESSLSLSFSSFDKKGPSGDKHFQPNGNTNWTTAWISLFFGVLLTVLFNHLNRKSRYEEELIEDPVPLQGAVIVLGISLVIRFLLQGYFFLSQGYYHQSIWNNLGTVGGGRLQALAVFEMCASLFSMAGTLALLYWFFKKRDIFPGMFVRYVIIFLVAQFMLVLFYYNLNIPSFDLTTVKKDAMTQLTRSIIYAAVWISFILKSEKVRQIFVCPYRI